MRTRGLNQDGDTIMAWERSALIPSREAGLGQDYFPTAKAGPLA
jgi:hypothetical protein